MKAIMVMFDSLNRRFLEPYGCTWVKTPNFSRLANLAATFDNSYVGSMPCMPARRELHTGRYNFLHRSWGPIEPFDDSMPGILRQNGIHTHLATDHYHYWQDGGCTYHSRYNTWEISRGQEGEPWICDLRPEIPVPENLAKRTGPWFRQDCVNRHHMRKEEDQPQHKTFAMGERFLDINHDQDNWFLQIETFDPHEPYFCPQKYKDLYPDSWTGPQFDWPPYRQVAEPDEAIRHARNWSAALHTMCDHYLGGFLDLMDRYDLWKDTMLIVNTDHGFLMSEHDWWGKCEMPFWNEIAHTPFFVWDPRVGVRGQRRTSLVQTIDIPATILEYFGLDRPADMQGAPLRRTIRDDSPVRQAGLFGVFGGHVNVTDGRHVYMRAPANVENQPLFEYTHMPTHIASMFSTSELQDIRLAEPFRFTKGCRTMKIDTKGKTRFRQNRPDTMLYDLQSDPGQKTPIQDKAAEGRMIDIMVKLMHDNDAPAEQFERLGISV